MLAVSRLILLVAVVLLGVGGLLAALIPDARPGAIWLIASALVMAVALVYERGRYRSDGAPEGSRSMVDGPGGELGDGPLPARFRPTEELFVDPTTGRRMRVWLDARTGDRRYREEP